MESDRELIEQAKKGRLEAFESLYYRYRDWVFNLAWRFCGNREQSLDVLQETFIYLLKKLPQLELRARMTTFLYPAVKHISLDIIKKDKRQQSAEEVTDEVAAPAEDIASDSRSELSLVLAVLTEQQREIILMRFVDDMSIEEIAAALNTPSGTVKSRLYNGLKILREDPKMKEYFFG